jgi:hypothetical protein
VRPLPIPIRTTTNNGEASMEDKHAQSQAERNVPKPDWSPPRSQSESNVTFLLV